MRRHPVRSPLARALLALALILAVLAAFGVRAPVTALSSYDQRFYLGIAYDLRQHGRFTDGFAYAGGGPDTDRPPGMRFTPLYPAFLAVVASFDPGLRRGIACVERTGGRDPACPRAAPVARAAQWAMLAGFYWLLWSAVGHAARSKRAGWIGLGVALLTAPMLLRFANTLMTETLSLLLTAAACVLAAGACRGRTGWRWFACGLMLGLAVLSRPAVSYLFWFGVALGGVLALRHRSMQIVRALAAFAAGTALVAGPWIARNAVVLHRPALTFGYASHTLIQRVAFDSMTRREYGLSFVCWLPDGAGLGRLIAGDHACDRFGWDEHAGSFYALGTGALLRQSLAASGGWTHHLHYVIQHYVLAHPVRYLLVTIPLALRGLYVDHYWGLLLAPVSVAAMLGAMMLGAMRLGRIEVLLLSVPAWFLLILNALVAVNQPRYNVLLILPFSLAGAMLAERLLRRAGYGERHF